MSRSTKKNTTLILPYSLSSIHFWFLLPHLIFCYTYPPGCPRCLLPRTIENICLLLRIRRTTQTSPRLKPLSSRTQGMKRYTPTNIAGRRNSRSIFMVSRGIYQGESCIQFDTISRPMPYSLPRLFVATMGLIRENGILRLLFMRDMYGFLFYLSWAPYPALTW